MKKTETTLTSQNEATPVTGAQVEIETPQQPVRKKLRRRRLPSW